MRVLLVTPDSPVGGFGGGANLSALMHRGLVEAGHSVSVAYVFPASGYAGGNVGVSLTERASPSPAAKIRARFRVEPDFYRPSHRAANQARDLVKLVKPDRCVLYGFDTMAAFLSITTVPKAGLFGVLPSKLERVGQRLARRRGESSALRTIDVALRRRLSDKNVGTLLQSLCTVVTLARNEADSVARLAPGTRVFYRPNPTLDEGMAAPGHGVAPYRVVMAGHLRGGATLAGLDFFARKIVPALERRGVLGDFRFEIVGKHEPPTWLRALLPSDVTFTGFVENFGQHVGSADAYLVPIPDDVGNRSRIAGAWSAGACVVTHASSEPGMPEIERGVNALGGETAAELAAALVTACTRREVNAAVRAGGRQTYERIFRPEIALPALVTALVDA